MVAQLGDRLRGDAAEALAELTANMVGAEDPSDVPPEQQTDGLKELVNVICGNLLPVLAGAEVVFDVHAPILLNRGEIPEHVDGLAAQLVAEAALSSLTQGGPVPVPDHNIPEVYHP